MEFVERWEFDKDPKFSIPSQHVYYPLFVGLDGNPENVFFPFLGGKRRVGTPDFTA